MRRYIEVPLQLLDLKGDGFHIMVKGKIHGKEAFFIVDTGASRTVFDPKTISTYIDDVQFEKKEGLSAGLGISDSEIITFKIESFFIGDLEIQNYEAAAMDLEIVDDMYGEVGLPHFAGLIGGDLLQRYKAVINYRCKKLRLTP